MLAPLKTVAEISARVLSRLKPKPDLRHISIRDFGMELAKLDDKIAEQVDILHQRGVCTEKNLARLVLTCDCDLDNTSVRALIAQIEALTLVTLTDNDQRLLEHRGYTVGNVHSIFKRRAWRQFEQGHGRKNAAA